MAKDLVGFVFFSLGLGGGTQAVNSLSSSLVLVLLPGPSAAEKVEFIVH